MELARWMERHAVRGLTLFVLALVGIPVFVATVLSVVLLPFWFPLRLPLPLLAARALADDQRRRALAWSGVRIARPYRPEPPPLPGYPGHARRVGWLLSDPASWRDVLWLLGNVLVGALCGAVCFGLLLHGVSGVLLAPLDWLTPGLTLPWWIASFPLGVGCLVVAPFACPYLERSHVRFAASLLAPTAVALSARVEELTQARSRLADDAAAELRRIERDLHDGPQARLAALGMNLGLAERFVHDHPDEAVTLLAEARASSVEALQELRRLVRGIHPPVLAERGLAAAVEALTLTLPIPVAVDVATAGRASPPTESALYFGISEALANVVKHSECSRAWVGLRHEHDRLTAVVGDNGVGGADPAAGQGLAGLRQRFAALDGAFEVTSPPGGPTLVTMEIPCRLS